MAGLTGRHEQAPQGKASKHCKLRPRCAKQQAAGVEGGPFSCCFRLSVPFQGSPCRGGTGAAGYQAGLLGRQRTSAGRTPTDRLPHDVNLVAIKKAGTLTYIKPGRETTTRKDLHHEKPEYHHQLQVENGAEKACGACFIGMTAARQMRRVLRVLFRLLVRAGLWPVTALPAKRRTRRSGDGPRRSTIWYLLKTSQADTW
ncbi:hypothetical protein B0T19DRAFT_417890 [Cercophora scortea]|uniref:Uncharacterized protein n=1 Tax=Cercophora scortea TaxID=314031 RepID=A0AAE0IYQ5_9PEZI|nr:hypothetical protein B0T19DRAFT_417890 [Cercophora scortea]